MLTFFADFGVFGVDETYNQHRLNDINHANLKLVCTHNGLDVGEDGKTHQCIDYLGLLANLYGCKAIVPADPNQTDRAVRCAASTPGNFYIGMGRSKLPVITSESGEPLFAGSYEFEYGKANRLSPQPPRDWPVIDEVYRATPADLHRFIQSLKHEVRHPPLSGPATSARALMLRRRSAQAYSGTSSLPQRHFYDLLDALLPSPDRVPWNSWPADPLIHLALFVHRVSDLPAGLYLLARCEEVLPELRHTLRSDFGWERVPGSPGHLPLYRLLTADTQRTARTVCCHQDIAASSFFSLAMLAAFDRALEQRGARAYPELFWEAGLIGQVLYLQAEAAGVRGTGIGCFFDDAMHEILGVEGSRFQSLYHFTVGQPKADSRLQTLPPYAHLQKR